MGEQFCTFNASAHARRASRRCAALVAALLLCPAFGIHAQDTALVTSVETSGLRESSAAGLVARFLGEPAPEGSDQGREAASALRFEVWRKRMDAPPEVSEVQPDAQAEPGRPSAFARTTAAGFAPGPLRGGEAAALRRAVEWLRGRGYPQARVSLEHGAGGAVLLRADEGVLRSFALRGVPPALHAQALSASGLGPGVVLSNVALRRAAAAITARLPSLTLDTGHPRGLRGSAAAGPPDTPPPPFWSGGRVDLGDLFFEWRYDDGSGRDPAPAEGRGPGSAGNAVEVTAPGDVLLWLRARAVTATVQWEELLRHTPATGFAPGLSGTLHLWDSEDRAHLALDAAFAVNTERTSRAESGQGLLERLSAAERVDALVGVRAAVPAWSIAELGAQVHALTDTPDAWRMGDLDSYVRSALAGQPDRDYLRRAGLTLLFTVHLFDALTLGAELRRDRFDPLPNSKVWSLLSPSALLPAALVTPGQIGALLLRAEWSSSETPLLRVGALRRAAETSLVERGAGEEPRQRALFTLEAAGRTLGSDPGIGYLRGLGDLHLRWPLVPDLWLRMRLRAALVAGAGVPLQKEESLGGWSALRGYTFKEYRGDASALATAELRFRFAGAFLDAGAVHAAGGWTGPQAGTGVQLFLEHLGRIEVAWRLDGHGGFVPSARALFGPEL